MSVQPLSNDRAGDVMAVGPSDTFKVSERSSCTGLAKGFETAALWQLVEPGRFTLSRGAAGPPFVPRGA